MQVITFYWTVKELGIVKRNLYCAWNIINKTSYLCTFILFLFELQFLKYLCFFCFFFPHRNSVSLVMLPWVERLLNRSSGWSWWAQWWYPSLPLQGQHPCWSRKTPKTGWQSADWVCTSEWDSSPSVSLSETSPQCRWIYLGDHKEFNNREVIMYSNF